MEPAETTGDKEAATRGTIYTTKAAKDGNATNQKPKNSSCDNGHKVAHSDVYFAKQKLFTQDYALSGDEKSVPNGDQRCGSKSRSQPIPIGREVTPVHRQLEGHITRPMGNRLHSGLHHRPGRTTCSQPNPMGDKLPQRGSRCSHSRGTGNVRETGYSRVPREQEAKGFISQLFLVSKKGGGKRPIINLKGLNTFVEKEHFKMESSHMIKDILKPGDWMTKVDLKDAYFMIPLATSQKQLVQFQWQGETYQFNCLPFGLTSAPRVFTKILKVAMTILRSLGLRMITYIDDILIMAETENLAKEHTA